MTALLDAPLYAPAMPSTAQWLTRTEAARRLRVKPGTIDTWAREGKLQRYFLGGSRRNARYRIEDVDALAEAAGVEPKAGEK